jgi:hypothetical protein
MRGVLIGAAVAAVLSSSLLSQSPIPQHRVQGHTITSEDEPPVRITLPDSAQYAGADRWVLYGMADCELQAFVDADSRKTVQRLYWVQFESYLPTRPDLHHTYDSPRHTSIGGMDFYVDTWARAKDAPVTPGSDVEHILALIRAKGYHMPENTISVRLVHLLDAEKRKELMIIYSEDIDPTGLAARDLEPGGKARERWPEMEKGIIQRAEKAIAVEPLTR